MSVVSRASEPTVPRVQLSSATVAARPNRSAKTYARPNPTVVQPSPTYMYAQASPPVVQPSSAYEIVAREPARTIPASYGGGQYRSYDGQVVTYVEVDKPSIMGETWEQVIKPVGIGVGAIVASPFILAGGVVAGAGAAVGAAVYGVVSTAKGFVGIVPVTKDAAERTVGSRIIGSNGLVGDVYTTYDDVTGVGYSYPEYADYLPWAGSTTEPQRITYLSSNDTLPYNYATTISANESTFANSRVIRPPTANVEVISRRDVGYSWPFDDQ